MKPNTDDKQEERPLRSATPWEDQFRSFPGRARRHLAMEIRDIQSRYGNAFHNIRVRFAAALRYVKTHPSLQKGIAVVASAVILLVAGVSLIMVHYWFDAGSVANVASRSPSRLFGAPLVFQKGESFDLSAVERALTDHDYRKARLPGVAYGTYRLEDDHTLLVGLRRYPVPVDGFKGDVTLRVRHANKTIQSIEVDGIAVDERPIPFEPPLITTYYGPELRDSRWVALDQIPPHVIAAVLATEDSEFMEHNGLSIGGIVRAAWSNLRAGEVQQGGSTITQQLVKNLLDWRERTLVRKIREAAVAILIEMRFEKAEILEAYLNEIYFGTRGSINLIGIGSASRAYFGRDVQELTLDEAALLAGMIRSPGRYSPVSHENAALRRRNHVLDRMLETDSITGVEHRMASEMPIRVIEQKTNRNLAPYFAQQVVREASRRWGIDDLEAGGYRILSSLRLADQKVADRAVAEGLEALGGKTLQGALVSVDPRTGEILTWVGGRSFSTSQFDRVASARRQLGSLFKPIVYASAIRNSELYPFDFVDDSPIAVRFEDEMWIPKNSDRDFRGRTTLRDSLELSLNVPTVKVAVHNGLEPIVDLAKRMGIETPMEPVPSLALGAIDATPLDVVSVYSTIAGNGVRRPTHGIRSIIDADGNPMPPVVTSTTETVLDERELVYLRSLLHGVVTRGTGWRVSHLRLGSAVAGKTGTSSDERDAWFAGFTPDRTTVVWVGRDDNGSIGFSGSRAALPIWGSFMKTVASKEATHRWELPSGYSRVLIDPSTGYLASEYCPSERLEIYPDELRPRSECHLHQPKQSWFKRIFSSREKDTTEPAERAVVVEREMQVNGISIIDLSAHASPLALAQDDSTARMDLINQQNPHRVHPASSPGGK